MPCRYQDLYRFQNVKYGTGRHALMDPVNVVNSPSRSSTFNCIRDENGLSMPRDIPALGTDARCLLK